MPVKEIWGSLKGDGLKFGIVVSRFNDFLTKELLSGALDCLKRHGAADEDVTVAWVPGANEISPAADMMAAKGGYQAIIGLGAVVKGATQHDELINSQVSRSLARTAIERGVPVINGVVCAGNLEQAIERCGTKAGNKGWNAAMSAIEMARLYAAM